MSSGVSGVFQKCAGCHKSFKRLASHIAQSPTYEQVYATCQEDISPNAGESNMSTQCSSTRRTRWVSSNSLPCTTNGAGVICNDVPLFSGKASAGIGSTIQQQEQVHNDSDQHDEDCGFASLDDGHPLSKKDADTSFVKEGEPSKCILKLYEELLELQANPLGLDRFSCKEKVHIKLLHRLKVLNAPLIAFIQILKCAAQANDIGHVFQVDCQPPIPKERGSKVVLHVKHEGVDTEGEAALSAVFKEDGFHDIF